MDLDLKWKQTIERLRGKGFQRGVGSFIMARFSENDNMGEKCGREHL